ncbi:AT-hook motif nuclear-localized protein 10 isoform X2 [Cryptomeria japonica]|uniref:AT-hook motif nuclear-localized protein 10 isoform X2 n=1 Tax=Cryptomeria japonica TaxID=3369 RepID=UPI0027DA2295|nr:AT-hook motif nuclear-localized protein 10 isoform X2 [Cryptomeria japonica]
MEGRESSVALQQQGGPPPSAFTRPSAAININNSNINNNPAASVSASASNAMVMQGVSNAIMLKRKRGRPRKYGPDGGMTLALPPPVASSSDMVLVSPGSAQRRGRGRPPGSGRKQQMAALGSAGLGFTPHLITVAAGEGRFDIVSLSGSFLLIDDNGTRSRTGGLSVSLAGPDGRVFGGGVSGMLMAATPVQVIVGSFLLDNKKSQAKSDNPESSFGSLHSSAPGHLGARHPAAASAPLKPSASASGVHGVVMQPTHNLATFQSTG